jgi:hypothetical protein
MVRNMQWALAMDLGSTTTRVNLRTGPGTATAVRRVLEPGTPLEIVAQRGDWLHVRADGDDGWVHHKFVLSPDAGVAPGLIGGSHEKAPSPISLAPAAPIAPPRGASSVQRQVAGIWNRYGDLLNELSKRLKIEPGVAVAVLAVESGGQGFADGRLIIRFENHHFARYWRPTGPATFNALFRYDAKKPWTKHEWRPATNRPWGPVHQDQDSEWACFDFACTLDETAAQLSISMGLPQVLGSNYAEIGYESVQQMFDAFKAGERAQVVGFFDFVQGSGRTSSKILALQTLDFDTFAAKYNGPDNAAAYGSRLRSCYAAFQDLAPSRQLDAA